MAMSTKQNRSRMIGLYVAKACILYVRADDRHVMDVLISGPLRTRLFLNSVILFSVPPSSDVFVCFIFAAWHLGHLCMRTMYARFWRCFSGFLLARAGLR